MSLPNEPITRTETYLARIAGQNIEIPDEPITRTEMYLDAIARSGGTGEGDMKKSVYDSDLSVASAGGISSYVTSAISGKANASDLGTAAAKDSTNAVTSASTDLVESGAVYTALQSKADKSDIAPTYATNVAPTGGLKKGDEFYLSDGILYRATTTISAGSAIVTSGGSANAEVAPSVVSQIAERMSYADNGVLGAKNLRDITKVTFSGAGTRTWNGDVLEIATTASDTGSYVSNVNANSWLGSFKNFDIIYSCEFKTDTAGTAKIIDTEVVNTTTDWQYREVVVPSNADTHGFRFYNESSGNHTLYIRNFMVRLATDTDSTYQPYAQTNQQLTTNKVENSVIGNVEDGASSGHAYTSGQHFVRNGKFDTANASISANDTLTKDTNYFEGDLTNLGVLKTGNFSNANAASNTDTDLGTITLNAHGVYIVLLGYSTEVLTSGEEFDIGLSISGNASFSGSRDWYINKKVCDGVGNTIQYIGMFSVGASNTTYHAVAKHTRDSNLNIYPYYKIMQII